MTFRTLLKPTGFLLLSIGLTLIASVSLAATNKIDDQLKSDAQAYMQALLEFEQPNGYFSEFPMERHDRFFDNTAAARERFRSTEDTVLTSLRGVDPKKLSGSQARAFYATFMEALESSVATRVCRSELWRVGHMGGPHTALDLLVEYQPMDSEGDRKNALARWTHAAAYFRQEIDNLESGLKQGYSAPQRVVVRTVKQLQGITEIPIDDHPFMALAERSGDESFTAEFKAVLVEQLLPSLKAYQVYLEQDYYPRARTELGIHALPAGRECYIALYRHYTTLNRTPEQVYQLGSSTVEQNKVAVTRLGKELYATDSFGAAVDAANADKSQRFASAEAMHAFYLDVVERAKQAMPAYFNTLPDIELVVEPLPLHQQGSGRSAHYLSGTKERPAKFVYDPSKFADENRGSAEIVTVHEGYPGHHMQIALVQEQPMFHPLQGSFWNSAFGEGWARYAENLSEEAGIYQTRSARILRRAWPARGMVVDTGLHLLGWSNEQAAAYLVESGSPNIALDPDALLDRMAVIPAQLTSYDSGALEIFALRRMMEEARAEQFDIREFHQLILENGMVPLSLLRQQVEDAL
jgi:uncharacterized protein (DUF885 family)